MKNGYLHGLEVLNLTEYLFFSNNKEIDFIAEKNNRKMYIQVAYLLQEEKIITREFDNLLSINDNFRKIVVTMVNLFSILALKIYKTNIYSIFLNK